MASKSTFVYLNYIGKTVKTFDKRLRDEEQPSAFAHQRTLGYFLQYLTQFDGVCGGGCYLAADIEPHTLNAEAILAHAIGNLPVHSVNRMPCGDLYQGGARPKYDLDTGELVSLECHGGQSTCPVKRQPVANFNVARATPTGYRNLCRTLLLRTEAERIQRLPVKDVLAMSDAAIQRVFDVSRVVSSQSRFELKLRCDQTAVPSHPLHPVLTIFQELCPRGSLTQAMQEQLNQILSNIKPGSQSSFLRVWWRWRCEIDARTSTLLLRRIDEVARGELLMRLRMRYVIHEHLRFGVDSRCTRYCSGRSSLKGRMRNE
jgi:hypothetical protein